MESWRVLRSWKEKSFKFVVWKFEEEQTKCVYILCIYTVKACFVQKSVAIFG